MKVCTDACLFGAWVAEMMKEEQSHADRLLDIGTGTGLLSLMLAQQFTADIDAVEIDAAAAIQAGENFAASPWKERLHVFHTDAKSFCSNKKYGLIISNPPFFEADLRSPDAAKNSAKHDTTLTLEELMTIIKTHLSDDGSAAILIPWHRTDHTEKIIGNAGLFISHQALVKQTPAHNYFRTMLIFSKKEKDKTKEEIIIHGEEQVYTKRFKELLGEYYLRKV